MVNIGKKRAIILLQQKIDLIETLKQYNRKSPEFEKWQRDTKIAIENIFPDQTNKTDEFNRVRYIPTVTRSRGFGGGGGTSDYVYQNAFINGLESAKALLHSIIDEIHQYWEDYETSAEVPVFDESKSLWDIIHPTITNISKSRFESGHFADSVEAAFKEINSIIKTKVKDLTGNEFDGASLMTKAFSVQNPIIKLDDISTETGRNIQQGYMQLYAGSMIGIRNPKAHNNIIIDKNRAIHFLFLASLLMYKLDEAII